MADATDLKSVSLWGVGVRVPPVVPCLSKYRTTVEAFKCEIDVEEFEQCLTG